MRKPRRLRQLSGTTAQILIPAFAFACLPAHHRHTRGRLSRGAHSEPCVLNALRHAALHRREQEAAEFLGGLDVRTMSAVAKMMNDGARRMLVDRFPVGLE